MFRAAGVTSPRETATIGCNRLILGTMHRAAGAMAVAREVVCLFNGRYTVFVGRLSGQRG